MKKKIQEELRRFNYLCSEIDAAYHDASVKCGLSNSEMDILYTIYDKGEGCSQSSVCKLSGVSRQTIHSAIKKMEKNGWIFQKAGEGRLMRIFLTEKGRAVMEEKLMPIVEAENEVFGNWTESERAELLRLTQKYLVDFRQKISGMGGEHND